METSSPGGRAYLVLSFKTCWMQVAHCSCVALVEASQERRGSELLDRP
jgi:hypothetical protein